MGKLQELVRRLIPGVCDVSVTNVCNATCDFCCYAYDKGIVRDRRWIDRADFARALPILYRRGIRYLTFQGGEPLLHHAIEGLVADTAGAGIKPALITNGWLLPQKIEALAAAGLGTLLVSIDSHSMEKHERNRGLRGLGERISKGIAGAHRHGITAVAVVTVNRLVNYDALPELLHRLGFDAATFSYPRNEPLGSSSLVYSQDSELVNLDAGELVDALEGIKRVKRRFPVKNPLASIAEMQRHARGEEEIFPCVGGYKYFYLDWNLDIWRCEVWSAPLGSVFDLDRIADQRDRCTACTMTCYRDTSTMMHAGIALGDAATALAAGRIAEAGGLLFRRSVAQSLGAITREAAVISRLARRRERGTRAAATIADAPSRAATAKHSRHAVAQPPFPPLPDPVDP
jgi:MoaA/NifB/PqqE/SkfB family radical SAM enzyme